MSFNPISQRFSRAAFGDAVAVINPLPSFMVAEVIMPYDLLTVPWQMRRSHNDGMSETVNRKVF